MPATHLVDLRQNLLVTQPPRRGRTAAAGVHDRRGARITRSRVERLTGAATYSTSRAPARPPRAIATAWTVCCAYAGRGSVESEGGHDRGVVGLGVLAVGAGVVLGRVPSYRSPSHGLPGPRPLHVTARDQPQQVEKDPMEDVFTPDSTTEPPIEVYDEYLERQFAAWKPAKRLSEERGAAHIGSGENRIAVEACADSR